jgi:hypothetical protein
MLQKKDFNCGALKKEEEEEEDLEVILPFH